MRPAETESFLLAVELLCLQWCLGAFLLTVRAFLVTVGAKFTYSGDVPPISNSMDCKQRISSVQIRGTAKTTGFTRGI